MSGSALSPWAVVRDTSTTTTQVAEALNCSLDGRFTSGVNFIHVLRAAFMFEDPKIVKIQSCRQYLFALLGSARVKAVNKMLIKLTTGGRHQTLLQCLRSVPLYQLMRVRPAPPGTVSPFRPIWGPSFDGVVVHSFRNRMRDYLERMAR